MRFLGFVVAFFAKVFLMAGSLAKRAFLAVLAKCKTEVFTAAFIVVLALALRVVPAYERVVFGVALVIVFGLGVVFARKYASALAWLFGPPRS